MTTDKVFMDKAFKEAQKAFNRKECPVGAVIVQDGVIVARDGNRESELNDPTAHAEILVLREAGQRLNKHTFPDCVIYTTLWPCPMCKNAMLRAKIPKVVSGARSFKYVYENTFDPSRLSEIGPIMEKKCRDIYVRWAKETGRDFILSTKAKSAHKV